MRIVSVVGARPQFIKLAPFDKEARKKHEHVIIHTGQHYNYEMSKTFFDELDIPEPDYNLEIGSGTHAWQTGQMLTKLGETLPKISPDLVIVYGDTNSTLAGALAAVKLHIPAGHVEAGYRSFDISMPEEVNRVITDRISQILFSPTKDAVDNLKKGGRGDGRVFFVGNIMTESLLGHLEKIDKIDILKDLGLKNREYAVLTLHRPENTNDKDRLRGIFKGLINADYPILFPVHPRTTALLREYGIEELIDSSRIKKIEPMKYLEFAKLQKESRLIITDSGGIQEEALLLGVPCLTLRYNTERHLTVALGSNELIGTDRLTIEKSIKRTLSEDVKSYQPPEKWDTKVSSRIIKVIDDNPSLLNISHPVGF